MRRLSTSHHRIIGATVLAVIVVYLYIQVLPDSPPQQLTAAPTPTPVPYTNTPRPKEIVCDNQARERLPMAVQIKNYWGAGFKNKPKPSYPTREILIQQIHQDVDPFDGFPAKDHPFQTPTMPTHLTVAEVKRIFNLYDLHPKFVVEVGSYVGGSAVRITQALDELGFADVPVLCVDTWLGTATQWLWRDPNFKLDYGRPGLYNQFMVNVINHNAQDHILPLVATGATGAHLLKAHQWQVDFLYLDAAHEVQETFREVCLYFEVLAVNGILAGDDYGAFPAVKHDVDRFVRLSGAKLIVNEPTWHIVKTKAIKDFTCWDWI